jgi:hypothetical protein
MNETVKITVERLAELEEQEVAAGKFYALEAAGVDNWIGFDDAMEPFRQQAILESKLNDMLSEIEEAILEGAYEPSERGAGYSTTQAAGVNALNIMKKYGVTIPTE